jgi:hypothetical protein
MVKAFVQDFLASKYVGKFFSHVKYITKKQDQDRERNYG